MSARQEFGDLDLSELHRHAVDPDVAIAAGLRPSSNGRGFTLPWPDTDGATFAYPRIHTDLRREGESKTRFPKGRTPALKPVRKGTSTSKIIVAEGFMQCLAVASSAPAEYHVLGMNGADGINKRNVHTLGWIKEREVWLIFDADRRSNTNVAAAARRVVGHLERAGAARVHLVDVPGLRNDGIDDVLAWWPHAERAERLAAMLADAETAAGSGRRLIVTKASQIKMRAALWLWEEARGDSLLEQMMDRRHWLPLRAMSLLSGREGTGKSTWAYHLAAQVTAGKLPGCFEGRPKSVVVAATEDDWSITIAPRLRASGADLDRVHRVDVMENEIAQGVTLPKDVAALQRLCAEEDVALVLLDPLMGAVDGELDSHIDQQVRIALEPVSRFAHEAQVSVLGLIHVNKSVGGDVLNRIMGSRAFAAVARSVLMTAALIGEDGKATRRFMFGQIKNNLAAKVADTIIYETVSERVGYDEEVSKAIWSSRIHIVESKAEYVEDLIYEQENRKAPRETTLDRCVDWLEGYLTGKESVPSAEVRKVAEGQGFKHGTLHRARQVLDVVSTTVEASTATVWSLPYDTASNGSNKEKTSNSWNTSNIASEQQSCGVQPTSVRSFDVSNSPQGSNEGHRTD